MILDLAEACIQRLVSRRQLPRHPAFSEKRECAEARGRAQHQGGRGAKAVRSSLMHAGAAARALNQEIAHRTAGRASAEETITGSTYEVGRTGVAPGKENELLRRVGVSQDCARAGGRFGDVGADRALDAAHQAGSSPKAPSLAARRDVSHMCPGS